MVSESEKLLLQTVTLNCHGQLPESANVMVPLFYNHKSVKEMPEFVVVALQDTTEKGFLSSLGNMFKRGKKEQGAEKKKTNAVRWQKLLLDALNIACEENYIFDEANKYVFHQGLASEGSYTALFCKKS